MNFENKAFLSFTAIPLNEAFARVAVSAFMTPLDPSISEISDVKTAVSEAVTNAVVNGYENSEGIIEMEMFISKRTLFISIKDFGCGIENIEESMRPLFTSKPNEERTGMGFTIMETFMDNIDVSSELGKGTIVKMIKHISEKDHE